MHVVINLPLADGRPGLVHLRLSTGDCNAEKHLMVGIYAQLALINGDPNDSPVLFCILASADRDIIRNMDSFKVRKGVFYATCWSL